jgi:hypothetical protein
MPLLIPPFDTARMILVKLFNCPSIAIPIGPSGPSRYATALILTKPVIILIKTAMAFRNDILKMSVVNIFFMLINFCI